MMHQEPSLYSLFEGTPWSPSLPASSGTSNLNPEPRTQNPRALACSNLCSDVQTTPPRRANPLTRPTPAACLPHHPRTATEPCPSLTSARSARQTAGTAGWWTAGRLTRQVRACLWIIGGGAQSLSVLQQVLIVLLVQVPSAPWGWTTFQQPRLRLPRPAGTRPGPPAIRGPIRSLPWRSRPRCCWTA